MAATVAGHVAERPLVESRRASLPLYLKAVLFASTSIILGLIWDIAWHKSIGRDTFWSPPHMGIYLGAVVAGLGSAAVIFRQSLAGSAATRARGVRMWGLTGPLGAFYSSWGAGAILTSAPLDDWWHNTYGLDTKVLSPPHVLLLLGIVVVQVGAMITALALQNRQGQASGDDPAANASARSLRFAYVYASGVILITASIMLMAQTNRVLGHSSIFYLSCCGVFPLFLVATAAASKMRWPATTAAAVYMAVLLANHWIMFFVPAEAKLAPIRHTITHMVPGPFPLLIIAPALAIDFLWHRWSAAARWKVALGLGVAFVVVFLAVQWPFSSFLMTPWSRNWFFMADQFSYVTPSTSYQFRHQFAPWDASQAALLRGLAFCLPLAALSSWLGLVWGGWMRKVQR